MILGGMIGQDHAPERKRKMMVFDVLMVITVDEDSEGGQTWIDGS